ncbi:phospholipase D-like domain-containing protein [Anabaena sp. UHCC 0451]|uniref:phospholipase D-like domain-containing protein n=1 Tax=Anabaena sp. UHCC 0451 TaxID=2055235 RepID=UPI002B1F3CC2|nr:phospholipase D-like domain-containing protein [Anabaena sp. UHCC 0451]MEA5576475.1 phospholipase D-like domain-containing protein [Anabaena sp. UHCC 0451]
MKIQIQLSGKFQRLLLSGTENIPFSVNDLMREVQAVATQHRRRKPQLLRQSFGLDFIPETVLINLCKQARHITNDNELYEIPSLKLLQPIGSQLNNQTINKYAYQFISEQGNIQLIADDPQLPSFLGTISEQPGNYIITIEQPIHPDLDQEFIQIIWNNISDYWQNLPTINKIEFVLQSSNSQQICINYQRITAFISIQELPLELRTAITFLRLQETNTSNLSTSVKSLVEEYQSKYRYEQIKLPEQLQPNSNLTPQSGFFIRNRQNRNIFHKIINDARQFLLISSYIIEDEELTTLICEKSLQLPQGVWILTDLRNEVLDRIDQQISDNISIPEQYKISDERKKTCLRMLLNANIPIRSGSFHLKTYISEKYAYLGSCNLTRGSLDINKEAGIVFRNNSQHQNLINLFQQFWQKRSSDEVIPESNIDSFRLRSLLHNYQEKYTTYYPNFLTSSQYERDLIKELTNFKGEVKIYSRSFQPSAEIATYLGWLDTQIFIDSSMSVKNQNLNIYKINNLHAKITILGNQVAYIGGINFNFNSNFSRSHDLMYKTTDAKEINQIIRQLPLLDS